MSLEHFSLRGFLNVPVLLSSVLVSFPSYAFPLAQVPMAAPVLVPSNEDKVGNWGYKLAKALIAHRAFGGVASNDSGGDMDSLGVELDSNSRESSPALYFSSLVVVYPL